MKINKNSKYFMRREEYDRVKKMDRTQFDKFCRGIYDVGLSVGKKEAQVIHDGYSSTEIYFALTSVKGIGARRAEEVIAMLESKKTEGNEANQKSPERKGGEENADQKSG